MHARGVFKEAINFRGRTHLPAFHFQQVIAYFHVHARLCQRRAQVGVPVLAVVDAREAVASVFNFVVRSQQSAFHLVGFGNVAPGNKHVPDGDFPEHFVKKIVEVGASAQTLQVPRVLLLGGVEVEPMMVRVVEEVPLDAPHFVVHLVPFGARVDVSFHFVHLQRALARFRRRIRFCDAPRLVLLPIQDFFAIARHGKGADAAKKWLGLARRKIKFRNGDRSRLSEARHVYDLREKQRSCLTGIQTNVVGGSNRKRNDALADSIQVNDNLDGFFFFLFVLLLAFFALVRVLRLVLFLLVRRLFFVALRLDRGRIALL